MGIADNTEDIRARVMAQFLAFPQASKEPGDLTDAEKLAICIAAGCKTELTMEGCKMTVRTVNPVGIVKIDGKFSVVEYRGE